MSKNIRRRRSHGEYGIYPVVGGSGVEHIGGAVDDSGEVCESLEGAEGERGEGGNREETSGTEKKEYVLDKVAEFAKETGIEADLQFISEKIEELVRLSKQVNVKRNE